MDGSISFCGSSNSLLRKFLVSPILCILNKRMFLPQISCYLQKIYSRHGGLPVALKVEMNILKLKIKL